MAQISIYIDKDYSQTPTYTYNVSNATEDTTQSFYQFLDQTDTYGNNAWDDIVDWVSGSSAEYEYTTNNVFGTYFRFWTQASGEKTFNSVSTSVTAQKDQWWDAQVFLRTKPVTFTLSFDSNGGSPNYNPVSRTDYPSGGYINIQIPSNYSPAKTNYNFDGWDIRGENFDPGDWVGLNSDATATAKWVRAAVVVALSGTTTSGSIHVNAPTNVPNDSTFFVWQLYQGPTLKKDDSENSLDAHDFTGLDSGTQYTVKFGAYTAATNGEQTARGEQNFTTTSSNIWIYTGANNDTNGWELAQAYIYTGSGSENGWAPAQAYIYTGSGSTNGWAPC